MNALLLSILETQSESGQCDAMQELVTSHAQAKGYHWRMDAAGNVYLTKGTADSYPCAVAHLDTVHDITAGGIVAVQVGENVTGINPVTMEQTGIGGDDKCGIYAALRCMESLPACKAAFFVDEEIGCRGSREADVAFFANCRFVLQADRRGSRDFVDDIGGPLASTGFHRALRPFLKRFGFRKCNGMMTDVEALRDAGIGISAANMSAGYYNPHSPDEYINLPDLENTVLFMVTVMRGVTDCFPFIAPPRFHKVRAIPARWEPGLPPAPREAFPGYAGSKAWGWEGGTWEDYKNVCQYCGWDARNPLARDGCAECQDDIPERLFSRAADRHLAAI